jgi:hypothetical protein
MRSNGLWSKLNEESPQPACGGEVMVATSTSLKGCCDLRTPRSAVEIAPPDVWKYDHCTTASAVRVFTNEDTRRARFQLAGRTQAVGLQQSVSAAHQLF